ncbi:hypothetical protein L1887_21852 [Cichorium endivia]|nr:hypothetical protein L1887_21852 [Cichorium endivia]
MEKEERDLERDKDNHGSASIQGKIQRMLLIRNGLRSAPVQWKKLALWKKLRKRATILPDEACVVFKESGSATSSLDWFHASPTSSDNMFMISANKIKDVGGCGADKWLSASEVNPKQLDRVETSCREGVCREMMKVAYE